MSAIEQASKRNVDLTWSISPDIPVVVCGDASRFKYVPCGEQEETDILRFWWLGKYYLTSSTTRCSLRARAVLLPLALSERRATHPWRVFDLQPRGMLRFTLASTHVGAVARRSSATYSSLPSPTTVVAGATANALGTVLFVKVVDSGKGGASFQRFLLTFKQWSCRHCREGPKQTV